jgi:hypothetical protein
MAEVDRPLEEPVRSSAELNTASTMSVKFYQTTQHIRYQKTVLFIVTAPTATNLK